MRYLYIFAILLLSLAGGASATVKAVASSTDLAAIAQEIGKDLIDVSSINSGKGNLHSVEILPSYMLKVSKADIYFKVGLALDMWSNMVIDGSRNSKLRIVDCSQGITVMERPTGRVDASMGDVHPEGNPHYWLDPRNGKVIAATIRDALVQADPSNQSVYQANYASFVERLDAKWTEWSQLMSPLAGTKIVSYHSTYTYFADAFGLVVAGLVEPKPGIEPTPSHTAAIIDLIKAQEIRIILREPYFSERAPQAIAKATGAKVFAAPSSVGGATGADTYLALFDTLISILRQAVGE